MKNVHNMNKEFARINEIFAPLSAGYPGAFNLTDDAAIVRPFAGNELVVTTDTLIASVHFMPSDDARLISTKLLRVNLSDLAAMGARPIGYTLNIALPKKINNVWLEAFAAGLAADQAEFAISLIGGDSVATSGPITLTLTAIGDVVRGGVLRRSGALAGDLVYVSGTLGDSVAGLAVAKDKANGLSEQDQRYLLRRYRTPEPRISLGRKLIGIAHSVIDISDGLVADLGHIANNSHVGIDIDVTKIPLSPAVKAALECKILSLDDVLGGGDDYELAVVVPVAARNTMSVFARSLGLPLTEVGFVSEVAGVRVLDVHGCEITPVKGGYVH